jgi:hypothetical protein
MAIPLLLGPLHDAGRLAIAAQIVNFLFSLQSIPIKHLGPWQDAEWLRIQNPTSPPRRPSPSDQLLVRVGPARPNSLRMSWRLFTGIWRTISKPDKKRAPFQVP